MHESQFRELWEEEWRDKIQKDEIVGWVSWSCAQHLCTNCTKVYERSERKWNQRSRRNVKIPEVVFHVDSVQKGYSKSTISVESPNDWCFQFRWVVTLKYFDRRSHGFDEKCLMLILCTTCTSVFRGRRRFLSSGLRGVAKVRICHTKELCRHMIIHAVLLIWNDMHMFNARTWKVSEQWFRRVVR